MYGAQRLQTHGDCHPHAGNTHSDTKSKDRDARKDAWDVTNKALNTLMIAHAAGLVACVTLLKDYKDNAQLKGLGVFMGFVWSWSGSSHHLFSLAAYLAHPILERPQRT